MKKNKICIITTQHMPDDMRVTYRIANSFAENNFKVDWYGPPKDEFKGEEGISYYYLKSHNRLRRLFELNKGLNKKKYNIYFAVDPDSAHIASIQARKNNGVSIFDIHERYHDDLLKLKNIKGLQFRILSFLIKRYIQHVINNMNLVIGVGPSRLEPYKINKTKTMILGHAVPRSLITSEKYDFGNNLFRIIHGKAALTRGTLQVLDAASILKHHKGITNFEIVMFKLVGPQEKSNIQQFNKILEKKGLTPNVTLLDAKPYREMYKIMNSCNLGVIAYQKDLGINAVPNRFFEYIATGIPFIYPNFSKDLNLINDKYNAGYAVDTTNPNELADAFENMIKNKDLYMMYSDNCKKAFEDYYWENEFKKLVNTIIIKSN